MFGAIPAVLDDRARGDDERQFVFGGLAPGERQTVELHVARHGRRDRGPRGAPAPGRRRRDRARQAAHRRAAPATGTGAGGQHPEARRQGLGRAGAVGAAAVRRRAGARDGRRVSEGNTVLIGHLAGPLGDVFARLDRLRLGDEVVAVSRGLEYRFVVSEIAVRPYDDVVPDPADDDAAPDPDDLHRPVEHHAPGLLAPPLGRRRAAGAGAADHPGQRRARRPGRPRGRSGGSGPRHPRGRGRRYGRRHARSTRQQPRRVPGSRRPRRAHRRQRAHPSPPRRPPSSTSRPPRAHRRQRHPRRRPTRPGLWLPGIRSTRRPTQASVARRVDRPWQTDGRGRSASAALAAGARGSRGEPLVRARPSAGA